MKKFSKCQSAFLFSIAILLSVAAVGCDYSIELDGDPCENVICGDNAQCIAGVCQCKEGYLDCSDAGCQNNECLVCFAKNNINHCGVCGNACTVEDNLKDKVAPACVETASDTGFMCDYTCKDSELNYCKDQANPCVNFKEDKNNCGGCGIQCNIINSDIIETASCEAGQCVYTCVNGKKYCDEKCVDTDTDMNNCGACGNQCVPGESCVKGACASLCKSKSDCPIYKYKNSSTPGESYITAEMECIKGGCLIKIDYDPKNFDFYKYQLSPGEYRLEVWGADGNDANTDVEKPSHGGLGGYASGILTLSETTLLYVHLGQKGSVCNKTTATTCGGKNGGGNGYYGEDGTKGYGGGGATDIRIGKDDLFYRVIVAGGGGGSAGSTGTVHKDGDGSGGYGGGERAGNAICDGKDSLAIAGAGQSGDMKFFGQGENAFDNCVPPENEEICTGSWKGIGGGGGGWFGGRTASNEHCGGSGGSGFVFTSLEQDAVKALGDKYQLDEQYKLSEAKIFAGNQEFPAPTEGTAVGHKGNGFAKITLLKVKK